LCPYFKKEKGRIVIALLIIICIFILFLFLIPYYGHIGNWVIRLLSPQKEQDKEEKREEEIDYA
jgi:hypothetical protein